MKTKKLTAPFSSSPKENNSFLNFLLDFNLQTQSAGFLV